VLSAGRDALHQGLDALKLLTPKLNQLSGHLQLTVSDAAAGGAQVLGASLFGPDKPTLRSGVAILGALVRHLGVAGRSIDLGLVLRRDDG
jgi:hypothetical protein